MATRSTIWYKDEENKFELTISDIYINEISYIEL